MPPEVKGLQKASLVDYPGKVCSTLFIGGCNFRCPFCQNPELVLHPEKIDTIPHTELLTFLEKRKKWIDGVCITGGEPATHPNLDELLHPIKELGLLVKLDTNGSFPGVVSALLDENLLDFVAMDIKAGRKNYSKAAGLPVNLDAVEETAKLLISGKVDYEFRTTAVPGFFSKEDAIDIAEWLKGAKRYALQQFRSNIPLIDPSLQGLRPFSREELQGFAERMKPHFVAVELRT